MLDSGLHCVADLGAEPTAADGRLAREELAIEPCCACRGYLSFDREIRSGGKREARPAFRILVRARLHDCTRPGIARHLEIGEPKMMRAAIDAFDDRVGRAFQLVKKASRNKPPEHGNGGALAVQRELRDVGLAAGAGHRPVHRLDDVAADAEIAQRLFDARLQRPQAGP